MVEVIKVFFFFLILFYCSAYINGEAADYAGKQIYFPNTQKQTFEVSPHYLIYKNVFIHIIFKNNSIATMSKKK